MGEPYTPASVAAKLDHAVLKPQQTDRELAAAAAMCRSLGVGCLCVRPADVPAAVDLVADSSITIASVVGFPHGSHATLTKVTEASEAIAAGSRELDMVLSIGALRSGRLRDVLDDIAGVVAVAKPAGVLVKVILETCFLSSQEIVHGCQLAEDAGADFVKTSTGFGPAGATPEAVALMLTTVGGRLGVKASGGIRDWQTCVHYLQMGCQRIGVGDAAAILCQKNGPETEEKHAY